MKKLVALLLTLFMIAFVFVGCKDKNNSQVDGNNSTDTIDPSDGNNQTSDGNGTGGNGATDDGETTMPAGKVTVTLIGASFADGTTTATYDANALVSVVAPEKEGKTFIAWKDVEGNVLEGLNDYDFIATENVTLKAEYVDNTSEGELYIDTDDGQTYYVAGVGSWKGNTLVIPDTYNGKPVNAVATGAFLGNKDIINLTIPDTVTAISDKAFGNCSNLKNVTLPHNYTKIAYDAFEGSNFITTLYFNLLHQANEDSDLYKTVPAISSLRRLVVGEGVKYVKLETLESGEYNIKHVELPDSAADVSIYSHALESINIPKNILRLYLASDFLSELTLPDGIEYINLKCKNLQKINLPKSLERVYLDECSSLKGEVIIPEGVTEFKLSGCVSVEKLVIEANVESLSYLKDLKALKTLVMPDTVKSIYSKAFSGCSSLENIRFSNNALLVIKRNAFSGCTALKEIFLPAGVKEIDQTAFDGSGLEIIKYAGTMAEWQSLDFDSKTNYQVIYKANTEYDFDAGLRYTSVGDGTCYVDFIPTVTLESYVIPKVSPSGDKVVAFAERIFMEKQEVFALTIYADIPTIKSHEFYNSNITGVSILGNTSTIGDFAFDRCSKLESITLGESVTTIANGAFRGCWFNSITLSKNLTYIGSGAFHDCAITADIYFDGSKEQWDSIEKGIEWLSDSDTYFTHRFTIHCTDGDITIESD